MAVEDVSLYHTHHGGAAGKASVLAVRSALGLSGASKKGFTTSNVASKLASLFLVQLIIMMTPVRIFFRVQSQSWAEWLFAIGVGAGALPLSLLARLASRRSLAESQSRHVDSFDGVKV